MSKSKTPQRIGILTAGGDCPGINAAIRGVGKTAIVKYNMQVVGISDGFTGMINKEYTDLTEQESFGYPHPWRNNSWYLTRKTI